MRVILQHVLAPTKHTCYISVYVFLIDHLVFIHFIIHVYIADNKVIAIVIF